MSPSEPQSLHRVVVSSGAPSGERSRTVSTLWSHPPSACTIGSEGGVIERSSVNGDAVTVSGSGSMRAPRRHPLWSRTSDGVTGPLSSGVASRCARGLCVPIYAMIRTGSRARERPAANARVHTLPGGVWRGLHCHSERGGGDLFRRTVVFGPYRADLRSQR
jgi:hypothetical protein